MEFEWDDEKAEANLKKHGIDFRDAARIFSDEGRTEDIDDLLDYGEERFVTIGDVEGRIVVVVYTIRDDMVRLISARKATPSERKRYAAI